VVLKIGGSVMRITEQERAALQRVETDVLPALMAITDEQLEDRAVAMDMEAITQMRDVANMRRAASSCDNLATHRLLLRKTIAQSATEISRFGMLASTSGA
jgi:hypothetical protein